MTEPQIAQNFWLPLRQPPHTPEAADGKSAASTYPASEFVLAEDPWGQQVCWRPGIEPHQLIAGADVSATAGAIQALAAQCARAHWAVYVGTSHDRKRYQQLQDWPNVRCVVTRADELIGLITHLADLLQERLRHATGGDDCRYAPVVVLLDNCHKLFADRGPGGRVRRRRVADALTMLVRLGRVVRIHVVIAEVTLTRHAASAWGPDIGVGMRELRMRQSPYLDNSLSISRRLGQLRPTRTSYPPLDIDRDPPPSEGEDSVNDSPAVGTHSPGITAPPMSRIIPVSRWSASTDGDEPDIEVGRYAVRTFTVDLHRRVLAPVSIGSVLEDLDSDGRSAWQDGVCEARCARGQEHRAPDENCSCGIYGATSLASLRSQYPDLAASIVAVIAAEGPTIIGSAGLRTSAARVVAYWCHPGPVLDEVRSVFAQQCTQATKFDDLDAMLAVYNIPTTTVDSNYLTEDVRRNMDRRILLGQLEPQAAQRLWQTPARSPGLAGRLRNIGTFTQRQLGKLGFRFNTPQ